MAVPLFELAKKMHAGNTVETRSLHTQNRHNILKLHQTVTHGDVHTKQHIKNMQN